MAKKVKQKRLRAKLRLDSIKDQTALSRLVGKQAPSSPIYQSEPTVKSSADTLVDLGQQLENSESDVDAAEKVADIARSKRDKLALLHKGAADLYAATVAHFATTPEEFQSLALDVAVRETHPLVTPLGLHLDYDVAEKVINVTIGQPPGITAFHLEVSTDPNDPTKRVRVKGKAATRALSGYAPGTYWFWVASIGADADSGFFGPVSILVG